MTEQRERVIRIEAESVGLNAHKSQELLAALDTARKERDALQRDLAAAREREAALREALAFYADERHYGQERPFTQLRVLTDGGELAAAVLASTEPGAAEGGTRG